MYKIRGLPVPLPLALSFDIANIVKILNDSGIESPMVHNARVGHKVWPTYDNKWLFCSVKRILRCTAYAGYWQKTINKKICTLPIAPILEEGMFEKVQEILDKRKKPRKTRPGKNGLFVKKIFDAETGRKISQRNFKTGETVFLFASGTNQLPRRSEETAEEAASSCESAVDMVEARIPARIVPPSSAGIIPYVLKRSAILTMIVSELDP